MNDAERIAQHRHCYVCGKAHTEDGRFCGGACKDNKKMELSKKKRQLLIIEVILVAITIGAILYLV
jgi:predicted nucleic acid-binding Zn ribbon protein